MNEQITIDFLRKRMIELRVMNGKSQAEMAELIGCNKSTLSRVEKIGGKTGYKTVRGFAEDYCNRLGLTTRQKALFLRGEKIVVIDTSALLKNPQLIDELCKEYSRVIIPDIVVDELDHMKDHKEHNKKGLAQNAWSLLKSISGNENVITMDYTGGEDKWNNDRKIIHVAMQAAREYSCKVDLITYDTGFPARLRGHEMVQVLNLEEYMITKQNLMDIGSFKKLNDYYADSYDDMERVLGIKIPNQDDINAYLSDGSTLIISVVRNRKMPMEQRKKKITWLMEHGADVNRRDCGRYYFPPLSHSIQNGDFEMFQLKN